MKKAKKKKQLARSANKKGFRDLVMSTEGIVEKLLFSLLDLLLSGDPKCFSVLLVTFLKIACLHVSFTAYENFYKLSKMHCFLVLIFHFPIIRMSECRNPTIKHLFTCTLISPFISIYVTDLFLVIFFT